MKWGTNCAVHTDTKMNSRKDLKNILFDKIQDFPGYWEPCKHNKQGLDAGWLYSVFQVRILSQSSLVHNGHLTKEEREEEEREGVGRKTVPHRGGMSSVNRPWGPEQKGPQSGWVPPLSVWGGWVALQLEGRAGFGEGSLLLSGTSLGILSKRRWSHRWPVKGEISKQLKVF